MSVERQTQSVCVQTDRLIQVIIRNPSACAEKFTSELLTQRRMYESVEMYLTITLSPYPLQGSQSPCILPE